MAVKPILFSAPMVRALLAGRKTQTRRILKSVPEAPSADNWLRESLGKPVDQPRHAAPYLDAYCSERKTATNPRGMSSKWGWWTRDDRWCVDTVDVRYAPGDVLWVKENHRLVECDCTETCRVPGMAYYDADCSGYDGASLNKLRPSIFMPRWANRLTLEVTGVKVERLQEISEQDAIAEGVDFATRPFGDWKLIDCPWPIERDANGEPPLAIKYAHLWNTINTKPGERWADNPWVVAVTFTVHPQNVETLLAQRKEAA